jgi:transcriptional regulator with XRE-family HTH domain
MGLSQLGLSRRSGLTHNFINDIENCKKWISDRTIAKLSTALNVEPYQFFLPESISNNKMHAFVNDFDSSFQKVMTELKKHYLGS